MSPSAYESYVLLTQHTNPATNFAEVWVWDVCACYMLQNEQIPCQETQVERAMMKPKAW